MTFKDKAIATLILLFIAASATAAMQRSKAVTAQAELNRRDQEARIDTPYLEALAETERKLKKIETELAEKNEEAQALKSSIEERGRSVTLLDSDYRKLMKTKPDENKTIERYEDADVKSICADFTVMGIPCESVSR